MQKSRYRSRNPKDVYIKMFKSIDHQRNENLNKKMITFYNLIKSAKIKK